MTASRPPKKSESLEIRIPYDTKAAFMALCGRQGASQVLREMIEARLAAAGPRARMGGRRRLKHLAAGALIAAAVGAVAAPSLARPVCAWTGAKPVTADAVARFRALDANHDGQISLAEFRRGETR